MSPAAHANPVDNYPKTAAYSSKWKALMLNIFFSLKKKKKKKSNLLDSPKHQMKEDSDESIKPRKSHGGRGQPTSCWRNDSEITIELSRRQTYH